MKQFLSAALAALLIVATTPAGADVSDLEVFLSQLDNTREELVDFKATFRQAKYASLFEETTLSNGNFAFRAPGDILLHNTEPDESYMIIGPKEVQFYFPLLEQVEVYPVDDQESLSSLLAVLQEDSKVLRDRYNLEYHGPGSAAVDMAGEAVAFPEARGLRLIPTDDALKQYFVRLDFWLMDESFTPVLVIIEEPTGDKTTIVFENLESNVGLTDTDFTLDLPEGTEIIRPETSAGE